MQFHTSSRLGWGRMTSTITAYYISKTETNKMKKETTETTITIPKMQVQTMELTLVGDSALICHAWSSKAKQEMLDKQQKKAKTAREAKDPDQLYKDSLYHMPGDKYGFPAVAFKSAAVDACSHVSEITKVEARGAFHIIGDMVEIIGKPSMRTDMVRIGPGIADIRFRGEFKDWKAKILIRYNTGVLTAEQIVNLFSTAGFAIGVGEWRPQKDGSCGMFHCE